VREVSRLASFGGFMYMFASPRIKIMVAMLLYIILPFDILPEAFLGPIGFLDDSVVLFIFIRQLFGLLVNFMQEEIVREGNKN
jgi:uncharacterized membrane protein YkvA (DUF1232 family)